MKPIEDPIEVQVLERLNEEGPDDLFICCASFEERCLSSILKFADNFQARFSVIFIIEEPLYEKEVGDHLRKLQIELAKKTIERVLVISCQRQNPMDGLSQFKDIWKHYRLNSLASPFITIDISGFTKIYILEILHYLLIELSLGIPASFIQPRNIRQTNLLRG